MDISTVIMMLLIGVFGGFISGLVGIGGAIIIYPAILLLPPLFGAPAYSAYIASGLTSSQVFFSTLSGSLKARKKPEFSPQLVLYMGGGMIIGSMLGALLANLFDATFVNMVYIIIALLALILMFINVKPSSDQSSFNKPLLVIVGLFVGIISGIVGAGGAFIIIPILLVLFKLPMNTVVANSIVIAFISSIGAFIIKLIQGFVPFEDALFLIIGSILFAPLGLKLSKKIPNFIQKWIISILIIVAIIMFSMKHWSIYQAGALAILASSIGFLGSMLYLLLKKPFKNGTPAIDNAASVILTCILGKNFLMPFNFLISLVPAS